MKASVGLPDGLQKVLLSCGILAALIYAGSDIIAGLATPGYNFATNSASLLTAFGAGTRPYVVGLGIAADILLIAFAVGAWFSAGHNWALRVTAALLAGNALFTLIAVIFFPMHTAQAMNAYANKMNVIFMAISVVLFFLAVCFGAVAFHNWFRYFSIGLIVYFFVADIAATWGLRPTLGGGVPPLVGVQERAMIYGELLWLVLLAIVLLRPQKGQFPGSNK
jgi:hypothetical protein